MRKHFYFSAFILLLSPRIAVASPADDAFFPWTQGTQWVYDMQRKGKDKHFDMKVTIEGPWHEGNLSGMIMTQQDHRGRMREFLLKNEQGIFIRKLGLSKTLTPEVYTRFTPAVPRVIYPLTPGTTVQWQGRLKVAWVDKPIRFEGTVVGWEDIEVPAGKFHGIKLFYDQKRGEESVQESAWYAEGVGQVRYDSSQFVKRLKSFNTSKQQAVSQGSRNNQSTPINE